MIPQFNRKIKGMEAGINSYLFMSGYPDARTRVLFTTDDEPLAVITCKGVPSFIRLKLEKLDFVHNIKHKFRFR